MGIYFLLQSTLKPGKWKNASSATLPRCRGLDRGTSQARVTNPKAGLPERSPGSRGCGDKRRLWRLVLFSHPEVHPAKRERSIS